MVAYVHEVDSSDGFSACYFDFFGSLTDVWTGGESEERDRARLEDKGAVAVCGDLDGFSKEEGGACMGSVRTFLRG